MAKHPLTRIEIEGWKSFRQTDLSFGSLTVLIGANGAGKSNLLSLFELFRAVTERRLQPYCVSHGRSEALLHYGPKNTSRLTLKIDLGGVAYRLALIPIHDGLLGVESEGFSSEFRTVKEIVDPSPLESRYIWDFDLFDRPRTYQFHDTSTHSRIRGFAEIHQTQYLHEDGGNLAAILWRMRSDEPAHFAQVERLVRSGIPGFSHFVLEPMRAGREEVRLEWIGWDSEYPMTPHQLSDGSLRWIALCTLLMQPESWRPGVVLIDEPELGLHPALLECLAGLIHDAAEQSQIIIATQSPFLLNFFEPEEVVTIDHNGRESSVQRHRSESLRAWLEDYSMGELWEKNVLGGQPAA